MKYFKRSLQLLLLTVIVSSCNSNTKLSEQDKKEILELESQYVKGWFKKNQKEAVLSTFEENAVFIPHHGDKPVKGIKKISQFFWPDDIGGIVHDFNHYPETIEGNNTIAWVSGRFDIRYSWIDKHDTITTNNQGNYLFITRKQPNSQWKISTFIFNDPVAQIESNEK